MNLRYVIRQLGLLILGLSLSMVAVAAWTAWQSAHSGSDDPKRTLLALLVTVLIGVVCGTVLWGIGSRGGVDFLGRREALLLVALSWLVGAALAGLPFRMWALVTEGLDAGHPFHSFASCYFEAMSGLTTTGATVLGGDEPAEALKRGLRIVDLPEGLLLWRSLTHWLGGLGIVVLFVAVFPMLGVGGKRLFQVEAPGPTKTGVRPRIGETARSLWMIYLVLTLASIFALRLAGLSWFDSVCHTFSMVSTGGLSTQDASIAAFESMAVDLVCIFFMLAAGVNFALYFQVAQGRLRSAWKDTELWVYLGLKVMVIAVVTCNLIGKVTRIETTAGDQVATSAGQALRYGAFQTVALHTGTGYCTADYDRWPFLSRALLVGLMFIGGCSGSTAGGIKVIRFWIALKVIAASLEKAFRPTVVRPLRLGGSAADDPELKLGAVTYFLAVLLLFGLGTMLLMLFEPSGGRCDFQTAMSAALSALCNIGPGLHGVGPTKNYGWFTDAGKLILSLLMCLGRLEMFAILVLFLPGFWRSD